MPRPANPPPSPPSATEHYLTAARHQFPGAGDRSILYWGAAANMLRIGDDSPFTVRDFREAVASAEAAHRETDSIYCGASALDQTGTYPAQCRICLKALASKDSAAPIPRLTFDNGQQRVIRWEGDSEPLTTDFARYAEEDTRRYGPRKADELAESVKAHGGDNSVLHHGDGIEISSTEVASLQTLCMRSLHRAGEDVARGLSDPGLILQRAMGMAETEVAGMDMDDEPTVDPDKTCRVCGKAGSATCTRCGTAVYCGRECQKKDWKAHKRVCGKAPAPEAPEAVMAFADMDVGTKRAIGMLRHPGFASLRGDRDPEEHAATVQHILREFMLEKGVTQAQLDAAMRYDGPDPPGGFPSLN